MEKRELAAVYTYPGELGKPMIMSAPNTSGITKLGTERFKQARIRDKETLDRKLGLLAQHHGAFSDGKIRWEVLARALANTHVEGFRLLVEESPGPGRPRKDYMDLYSEILASYVASEMSIPNVCANLAKSDAWKSRKPKPIDARFAALRFHEVKRFLLNTLPNAPIGKSSAARRDHFPQPPPVQKLFLGLPRPQFNKWAAENPKLAQFYPKSLIEN
ncbi:hypothetical protein [Mesorhizobium sp. LjNodule214]|uniref:hypothetical protein n=1 Tax=Mesorhizobium sp. LjNodule214 TaxID=3342252 RepID=UPI003ECC565F